MIGTNKQCRGGGKPPLQCKERGKNRPAKGGSFTVDGLQVGGLCDTCAASMFFSLAVLWHMLISTVNFSFSSDDEHPPCSFPAPAISSPSRISVGFLHPAAVSHPLRALFQFSPMTPKNVESETRAWGLHGITSSTSSPWCSCTPPARN